MEHIKAFVRRHFPDAAVVPSGHGFVVMSSGTALGKPLGQTFSTPERAWRSAMSLIQANA